MISNGIVTNEEIIASDPELVTAFVAAFDHGLRDTINNPSEAYLLSAKYIDGLPLPDDLKAALERDAAGMNEFFNAQPNPTREAMAQARTDLHDTLSAQFDSTTLLQFRVLLASIDMWDADQLGYTDPASWQVAADTLTEMGLLTEPVDLASAYTNEFLPENP
jgi:NitT/TauT family transport system substrate-binding protein